jgi:methionyl-tRNA formyltransferase
LQHFAKRQDVPYIMLTKTNHDVVEKCVREWKPDLIVVSSMSQLLRRSIFDIPPWELSIFILQNYRFIVAQILNYGCITIWN